jgi:hypothetical protein
LKSPRILSPWYNAHQNPTAMVITRDPSSERKVALTYQLHNTASCKCRIILRRMFGYRCAGTIFGGSKWQTTNVLILHANVIHQTGRNSAVHTVMTPEIS